MRTNWDNFNESSGKHKIWHTWRSQKVKAWPEGGWSRAMNVHSSGYPATHHHLHCSRLDPQPTLYHSNPGLRLTQWTNKAQGLGFHPRSQGCSREGEQIMPRANVTWLSFLFPSHGRGDGVRGFPEPTSNTLLPDLPSHCTVTSGTEVDGSPPGGHSESSSGTCSLSALTIYFPSVRHRALATIIIPSRPQICPYLLRVVCPCFFLMP